VSGYLGFIEDMTTEATLRAELLHQASHDALTQLLNRRGFDACLSDRLAKPGQPGHALLYIDLDQFKIINDAAGHSAGDRLLVQVARLLESLQGPGANLARLGGDEFGLILSDCSLKQAEAMAARIIERLEDYRFEAGDQRFRIGVSIGVVPLVSPWLPDAVMQAADTSCFTAKEAGRNRWHTWAECDEDTINRNQAMRWATRLQRAIDEERLELHAQRILPLDPADGEGLQLELLLRIREADGALVMPGAFLPPAERFQIVTRLDQWVLQQAITMLSAQDSLEGIKRIGLNVSGQSVVDPSFLQAVDGLLALAGPAISSRLCFEITETAVITNVRAALAFIAIVTRHRSTVALDDFGSGMASFGTLKSLNVSHLKIDGQFVTGVIDDPLDDVAVRCFVEVAHVMGLRTVAEFVESEAVLQRLRQIGVHGAQGFHLHRPEPFERVLARGVEIRQA
jgi:diguanylate cyclase (GGDEF)-like protein